MFPSRAWNPEEIMLDVKYANENECFVFQLATESEAKQMNLKQLREKLQNMRDEVCILLDINKVNIN